jgi:hypothetical protein
MKMRICGWCLLFVLFGLVPPSDAAVGKGAQALLQNASMLSLSAEQKSKINAVVRQTVQEYNRIRQSEHGKPGAAAKLDALRAASQVEALKLLSADQRRAWQRLVSAGGSTRPPSPNDRIAARSLIIPTIAELKNPPSPNAYGPSTGLAKTSSHPPLGDGYVVVTDHRDPVALRALDRLAKHRGGEMLEVSSLGNLFKMPAEFDQLSAILKQMKPRFVAVAPRLESYRENMHLGVLKLLAGLDGDPQLDAFPGYLIASDASSLAALVNRTIGYRPLSPKELAPVSIGAIEDDNSLRYRSYQKAKVMQKLFADQGKESPAIIITTRKLHTERSDFPKLNFTGDNIAMLPIAARQTFARLSAPATEVLNRNNLLFMFGHGTSDRIVGTQIDAFAGIDFSNELVFCGSCMSASPYQADRLNLSTKKDSKRFAFHVMDNGAVMLLAHMGLCGGFPKVYPMAEHVLEGMSAGEAYQRLMNTLIGDRPIPGYYSEPAPSKPVKRDPANGLLYILWGDPALVPIKK